MNDLLIEVLCHPEQAVKLREPEWELLIRQGRTAMLLGRIGTELGARALMEHVPPAARRHLDSALAIVAGQQRAVRWEVDCIKRALVGLDVPVVLLKGAAYVMADLPAAAGRFMSDIDILVPRASLAEVEAALMFNGWVTTDRDPYNQRYYRTWMHELPPLRHMRRGTVVDVHHAILPATAHLQPNPAKLFEAAETLATDPRFSVLAPVDMLLHSATHLFHDGELEHGLRDLVDLDSLLRRFGDDEGFWPNLVPRAIELELTRPLFYGLRYVRHLLGTPIPQSVMSALLATTGARPSSMGLPLMDGLFLRALRPAHLSASDRLTPLARYILYIRAHWLRMPPTLLIYHLVRKAVTRSEKAVETP